MKDIVAQIRAKLSDEELVKVSSLLGQIERAGNDLKEDLSAANSESKSRKLEIRELKSKLEGNSDSKEDYEAKLKKLKDEVKELKGIKEEFNGFKAKQLETSTKDFEKIVKQLTVEETDPKFETYSKVLSEFTLGTEEQPLTADQIKANLTIYKYAKDFGGLELKDKPEEGVLSKGGQGGQPTTAFETFLTDEGE